jgi:hypothetical protein
LIETAGMSAARLFLEDWIVVGGLKGVWAQKAGLILFSFEKMPGMPRVN